MTTEVGAGSPLQSVRKAWLDVPDEAVFLERARIIVDAAREFDSLPQGLREGRILAGLCERITPVVNACDVFLGRALEQVPNEAGETFIREHPELFIVQGVPGLITSTGIYCPDWGRLLTLGIGGLLEETQRFESGALAAGDAARAQWLEGVFIAIEGVSHLAQRYAQSARAKSAASSDRDTRERLARAAEVMKSVSREAPRTFRGALQLHLLYHFVLAAIAGGRNVTPGRMDRWLWPFYERDLREGRISRDDCVELLAIAMTTLSQLSGSISTDFQSKKRTPNRYSHYYVTLGGTGADGRSKINDLSFAILDAARLAGLREPTILVRYSPDIDRRFWRAALAMMRDGLPVIASNDAVATEALANCGAPREAARDYVYAGCMNALLSGRGTCCLRDNLNLPAAILRTMNNGRDPSTGRLVNSDAPPPDTLDTFEKFFDAIRLDVRRELNERFEKWDAIRMDVPLPAWPLFAGHLAAGHRYLDVTGVVWDEHVTGIATAVDSLLAVKNAVYDEGILTLSEFSGVLRGNFAGDDALRAYVSRQVPSYGSDKPQVLAMIDRVAAMWVEEVERLNHPKLRVRPGFHSWLYNVLDGKTTAATPDGRLAGVAFSSDWLPSPGKAVAPTATLRTMARLPHRRAPSGGATLGLDAAHFAGEAGSDLLAALVEGYFAEGGLQLHCIFTDHAALEDALENPERHRDLLVRVTGYSEYFVRLLPEVQRDIIKRSARRQGT